MSYPTKPSGQYTLRDYDFAQADSKKIPMDEYLFKNGYKNAEESETESIPDAHSQNWFFDILHRNLRYAIGTAEENKSILSGISSSYIPSSDKTSSVTSGSTKILTSGGAYTNLVKRASTTSATGSATKPVYINASGVVAPITSYEGNSASATKATQDGNGLVINDNYSKRRGEISGNVNWNNYTEYGCYKVQKATMTAEYNAPVSEYGYGLLVVEKSSVSGENRTLQIYYPHVSPTSGTNYRMWTRMYNGTTWNGWSAMLTTANTAPKATADANGNNIVNTYQPKSTAVTHTASTAVGSASKPVYIASNGVATACTNSIPSIYLKTSYVNGDAGYNIWSNGYCEQWGRTGGASRDQAFNITLLKKMKDGNYFIGGSSTYDQTAGDKCSTWSVQSSAPTGFTIKTRFEQYNGAIVLWKVSGYLATGEY